MTTPLTPAWTTLRYHPEHARLWYTKSQYCAVAAGRGSGKSELARRRVVRYLQVTRPWSDPLYFYALPTFAQAKRVAWGPIKRLIPKRWIRKISETELFIETIFGSTLYVLGMDKPSRAEGVQWDGGVLDESGDQRPGVFDTTFVPAFSHRRAWCWRIGVPKRYGVGTADFKAFFDRGASGEDPDIQSFTWPSRDILTAEALRFARDNLDPVDFSEQYEANWEKAGGAVFHAFAKDGNISPHVVYRPDATLIVGSDCNVNPMCWVLAHKVRAADGVEELHVFDELVIRNTNTERTLSELHKRYGRHASGWAFFGDATGRARKTAAAESDYLQIRNDRRFEGARVFYPRSNPSVVNRFAACNALFRSASGRRRCKIHPKCKRLIDDLEQRAWKEGTREPDDYGDLGHASDAMGYIVTRLFPLTIDDGGAAPHVFAGSTS